MHFDYKDARYLPGPAPGEIKVAIKPVFTESHCRTRLCGIFSKTKGPQIIDSAVHLKLAKELLAQTSR
jgi:hypothetical protein